MIDLLRKISNACFVRMAEINDDSKYPRGRSRSQRERLPMRDDILGDIANVCDLLADALEEGEDGDSKS